MSQNHEGEEALDEAFIARLRASDAVPAEADDPRFWQRFSADLDQQLAARPRRRRLLGAFIAFDLLCAAAALLLFVHPGRHAIRPIVPSPIEGALAPAALDSSDGVDSPDFEDPCQLIGDLDADELSAVARTLKTGA